MTATRHAMVEAFGPRLRRPVRAIIYTHSYPDHTGGARAFAGNDAPDICGHGQFLKTPPDVGRAGQSRDAASETCEVSKYRT